MIPCTNPLHELESLMNNSYFLGINRLQTSGGYSFRKVPDNSNHEEPRIPFMSCQYHPNKILIVDVARQSD